MSANTFDLDKKELIKQSFNQMDRHLQGTQYSLAQKLALTCRILFDNGHDSGLAGQITARGEEPGTYLTQRLGLGLNDALQRMGERVASQDLQYFITAVLLQTETGGNLAEIMENIGHLIRERLKLKGKVRALTAEGRYSALILALLPFVVFVALYVLNRSYVDILFKEPAGPKIIAVGIISIILGIYWMRRIIEIKV